MPAPESNLFSGGVSLLTGAVQQTLVKSIGTAMEVVIGKSSTKHFLQIIYPIFFMVERSSGSDRHWRAYLCKRHQRVKNANCRDAINREYLVVPTSVSEVLLSGVKSHMDRREWARLNRLPKNSAQILRTWAERPCQARGCATSGGDNLLS